MKLLPLALLLSSAACFDFTATRQAGIGGRCGDLDHYCDDGLTCQSDVCIRKDGSNEGETCSADITCASGLVCNSGQCGSKCALTNCGEHGECTIDGKGDAVCSCDPGYRVENGFCAGLLDIPCGDAQVCYSGLLCSNGTCASPCDNGVCAGGRTCNTASNPPACVCPLGTVARDSQCVDVCSAITCSGRGECLAQGQSATCACNSGFVPNDNGDCVIPNCTPTPHATQLCFDNDVYWYDSCGAHEDLASECGIRGCETSGCVPPHWDNRDLTLTGIDASVADASFTVTSDRRLMAVVADTNRFRFYVWKDGWTAYSDDAVFTGSSPVIKVNRNDVPSVVFTGSGANGGSFLTFAGCSWCELNSSGRTGFGISAPNLTFNGQGAPVVVGNSESSGRIVLIVRQWTGATWELLNASGGTLPSYGAGTARSPSPAFDADGDLYVAWFDSEAGQSVINRWSGGVWQKYFGVSGPDTKVSLSRAPGLMSLATLSPSRPGSAARPMVVYEWEDSTPAAEPNVASTGAAFSPTISMSDPSIDIAQDGSTRAVLAWAQNGAIHASARQRGKWGPIDNSTLLARAGSAPTARIANNLACVSWRDESTPKTLKILCAILD